MDTLDLYRENTENTARLALNAAIIGTIIFLLPLIFNPPLMADDVTLAHAPIPGINLDTGQIYQQILEDVSPEARKAHFEQSVRERYKNAIINDVDVGIKHIRVTRYYDGKPVRMNIVEVDRELAKNYELRPALSSQSDNLHNKRTITTIAKNTNSVVAINGTFFKPQTGVPLGTLMINEKIYTGPIYNRVSMGIFEDGFAVARVEMNARLSARGKSLVIDNINQPRMLSSYTLAYTQEWGTTAPPSPKYGYQIAIKDNKIIQSSSNPLVIPEGGYVIVAPYRSLEPFLKEQKVNVEINTLPEWKNVKHIISGGPYLVKDGSVYVDISAQKLNAIGGKNPRTAIGYTKDNTLIMVAVDGRENQSVGMTLMQLANFMKSLGCTNAINLDGGGSTVMYVNGQVVNNPAFKGGIAISNALVLSKK